MSQLKNFMHSKEAKLIYEDIVLNRHNLTVEEYLEGMPVVNIDKRDIYEEFVRRIWSSVESIAYNDGRIVISEFNTKEVLNPITTENMTAVSDIFCYIDLMKDKAKNNFYKLTQREVAVDKIHGRVIITVDSTCSNADKFEKLVYHWNKIEMSVIESINAKIDEMNKK